MKAPMIILAAVAALVLAAGYAFAIPFALVYFLVSVLERRENRGWQVQVPRMIWAFAVGQEDPERDLAAHRETAERSWQIANEGMAQARRFALFSGRTLDAAAARLAELPGKAPDPGSKDLGEDGVRSRFPARILRRFSGNPEGGDAIAVSIGLAAIGIGILFFAIYPWFMSQNDVIERTEGYYRARIFVTAFDIVPDPHVGYWLLGMMPLCAAGIGLGFPLLRAPWLAFRNHGKRLENTRIAVGQYLLDHPGAVSAGRVMNELSSSAGILRKRLGLTLAELAAEHGAVTGADGSGAATYRFET